MISLESMESSFLIGYFGREDVLDTVMKESVMLSVKKDICIIFTIVYHNVSCPIGEIPDSFWYAMGVYARKVRSSRSSRDEAGHVYNDWQQFKDTVGDEWITKYDIWNTILLDVNSTLRAKDFDPSNQLDG